MKIENENTCIEFGEADRDWDMLVSCSITYGHRIDYLALNQDEIKALIAHLQKQVKQDE